MTDTHDARAAFKARFGHDYLAPVPGSTLEAEMRHDQSASNVLAAGVALGALAAAAVAKHLAALCAAEERAANPMITVNFAGGRIEVKPVGSDTQAPLLLGPAPTAHQVSAELARVAAAVAPRCPSCDGVGLTRTEHGAFYHGACSWHGASLTAPVVPRFAVGERVRFRKSTMQVLAVHAHAADSYQYDCAATVQRDDGPEEFVHRGWPERDLEACEAPR